MTIRISRSLCFVLFSFALSTIFLSQGCSEEAPTGPSGAASSHAAAASPTPENSETLPSGLIISKIVEGDGASPGATDMVEVHYHGTFPDGRVFDSSVERGQPASFPLNRVIKCWTEGLQLMKVGGKALLICPPDIAYGPRGRPPKIPGNSTLHFEVELLALP
ncbi:MAG: FKBP-type peptidyl-prolyl cis-trans isomerase [Myxococcota bacterium]|jgi:FKBP-type peptidyl-prolyl cis-trans isomerase FkpA|nr:FKBP-type peptidyl-prolyl cis-trans isomerase [Myxococcota bacterium]